MTDADDTWAGLADRFVDEHYGSLRGRVRTHVLDQHLTVHLPPVPASVVDVGGGAGHQSLPLARRGYDVTIIDPSPAMLERATGRLTEEPAEVADRVTLVQAAGEVASSVVGVGCFDGVLCHGVVMYVDDPEPLVSSLCSLVRPGGVVSIVAKNADALAVRPALAGEWSEALAAFDAERQVNGLGLDTRADTIAGMTEMLERGGVDVVSWYGVRLFTDGWSPERAPDDPDDLAFAVELAASRRDPYRRLSRLFHLVGRRRG